MVLKQGVVYTGSIDWSYPFSVGTNYLLDLIYSCSACVIFVASEN